MIRLAAFDIHRAGVIGGPVAIGAFLETIDAESHAVARKVAELLYAGEAVVVVPHRKPNEKLERAVRRLPVPSSAPRVRNPWKTSRPPSPTE